MKQPPELPLDPRQPGGIPFVDKTNAVDAVAVLSGVNTSSVIKVFTAMNAIRGALGVDRTVVLESFHAMPLDKPKFDGSDDARLKSTARTVAKVAASAQPPYVENILHLRNRFPSN